MIRSLADISYITAEILNAALTKCCSQMAINQCVAVEIFDLINDLGGFSSEKDLRVINYLAMMIVSKPFENCKIEQCFIKLVDMGAVIHGHLYLCHMTNDTFYYYIAKNNIDINLIISDAVAASYNTNVHICDWLFEQWLAGDVDHDLDVLCHIVIRAHQHPQKKYFARVLRRVTTTDQNINKIMMNLLMSCYDLEEISETLLECVHCDELVLLYVTRIIWNEERKFYSKPKYISDFSRFNAESLQILIENDKDAEKIYREILEKVNFRHFNVGKVDFDDIINTLSSLIKIYDN